MGGGRSAPPPKQNASTSSHMLRCKFSREGWSCDNQGCKYCAKCILHENQVFKAGKAKKSREAKKQRSKETGNAQKQNSRKAKKQEKQKSREAGKAGKAEKQRNRKNRKAKKQKSREAERQEKQKSKKAEKARSRRSRKAKKQRSRKSRKRRKAEKQEKQEKQRSRNPKIIPKPDQKKNPKIISPPSSIIHFWSISDPFLIQFLSKSLKQMHLRGKTCSWRRFQTLSTFILAFSSMDSNSVLATLANRVDAARRASCSVLSGLERVKYGCVDLLLITNVWWWQLFFWILKPITWLAGWVSCL